MRIKSFVQRHAVFSYFVLAFAITWSGIVYIVGGLQGIPGESDQAGRLFPWVFLAMVAGPTVASLLVTAVVDGRAGLRDLLARQCRWRVPLRWYGVALLTTPVLLLLILGALAMWVSPEFMPGILATPDKRSLFVYALVGGLAAGFFEELGWTGFATPKMRLTQRGLGATLGLGALWMTWHLLGDYWGSREYGSFYGFHVLFWYLALMAYRVLMTWVYSHTESLLVGQLMHVGFTGGQALLYPIGLAAAENVLWYGIFAVALWIVVAVVITATRARPMVRESRPASAMQTSPTPLLTLILLAALALGGCVPNPASQNCIALGGKLVIEQSGNGGQFGVCFFEDDRQCEEWALLQGECPLGGLKVTGYGTLAARYCAITGGTYTVTGNSGGNDEQGTCTLASGGQCDAWAYYNGTCGTGSAALPATSSAPAATSDMAYDDPFAYCAAVGTLDAPDQRYTGPAVPDPIVQGLRTAMETPDAPAELFAEGRAFWRCMDSRVYACVVGANIPCTEKADLSQEPTAEMAQFCQENPGAEVIPAYVTGRATIYAWRCEDSTPTAGEPVAEVDAQGYNQNFWYELSAP